jgi:chromosome partitioning protein
MKVISALMQPMKVLVVIMQKGGAGKTTLVQALAVAAKRAGLSVAVIDLDPQATTCKWGDRRQDDLLIISIQAARLPQALNTAREGGVNIVIIDTPPRAADAAMAAAQAADLILIPVQPTINDLETLATTQSLIAGAGSKAAIAVVLNGVPPQGPQREQAIAYIKDLGLPMCPMTLGRRAAYTHAAILGQTAQEYDPRGKAAEEIEHLYKFTCNHLNSLAQEKGNIDAQAARSA